MTNVLNQIRNTLEGLYLPKIQVIDVIEILLIAFLIYFCMLWIQRTRAYSLLKGFLIVMVFIVIAALFQMSAILWIASFLAPTAITILAIIFQPELRKGLESLGTKTFLASLFSIDYGFRGELFSDRTITEILRAVNEMSESRTGALIVIEQSIILTDFINTGILLDSEISSQLLVNIFEHNTPLHDGAVIIRGNRIMSATSYLPLSDNAQINKKYGTRHRAGLGISEATDSFTIIVSEETGRVSYAYKGNLTTGITASSLREQLHEIQKKTASGKDARKIRFRKGKQRKR